jgi:hypothetical protein
METTPSGEHLRSRFTLRKCLWLSLPALLIGAILRISMIAAVPEAYYGADSNSYFGLTKQLIIEGKFRLEAKRRWLYPMMLVPTPFVPGCNVPQVVAVLQHALGLGMIFGIGWVAGNLVRRPALWVPPVTILAAIWPRMLWYEHEIIAEAAMLGAFVCAVALASPVEVLRDRKRLLWFFLAALIMVAIKPHGRPLWLGMVLAAALITRSPLRWGWKNYALLAATVVVFMTAGSGSQGTWLFLNSALPFVKTEGAKWAEYRQILKPQVELARGDLANYAFRQSRYKKMLSSHDPEGPLGPEWAELTRNDDHFTKVAGSLAKEAVLSNPIGYARLVLMKVWLAFSDDNPGWRMIPQEFWRQQMDNDLERWEKKPRELQIVYELPDRQSYLAMTEERVTRTLWFEQHLKWFTKKFAWTIAEPGKRGQPPTIGIRFMGCLALLGLVVALSPARFVRTSILWLPLLLYLGLVFAVGDAVTRYLHPIEWILFILIAIGLEGLLDAGIWLVTKARQLTPARPAATA